MLAAQFTTDGEPEVLEVAEVPEPHAGLGEVRIAVRAASLDCIDYRLRAGELSDTEPAGSPVVSGYDAAGVVDEVGAGVAACRSATRSSVSGTPPRPSSPCSSRS